MSAADQPPLWDKMRALADRGHAQAADLREKAAAFEKATAGFYAQEKTCDVKSFMGCWARARRLYAEAAGVPLMGD